MRSAIGPAAGTYLMAEYPRASALAYGRQCNTRIRFTTRYVPCAVTTSFKFTLVVATAAVGKENKRDSTKGVDGEGTPTGKSASSTDSVCTSRPY